VKITRIAGTLGALVLALVVFQTEARAGGTASGTTVSNRAIVTWSNGGVAQDTIAPAADTTVRTIKSDTLSAPADQNLTVGETKIFTYTFVNTGNAADTFNIWVDSFSLNNGAVGWTFRLYSASDSTSSLNDTKVTASVAADGIYSCSVAVWSHSTPANSPDGAHADFRLVISPGNVNTADTYMQYTGDNGTVYATGTGGSNDVAVATLAAARLTLAKAITSVTLSGGPVMPLPGATILYTLTYNNVGTSSGDSVILRDTIPTNTRFDTASSTMSALGASATFTADSGLTGWTCQVATAAGPDNNYHSPDWINLPSYTTGTVTYVRWIRDQVAAAQTATIRFRVIIQ
jgi:uncharacterized repeat protein (TIGR01451 family)